MHINGRIYDIFFQPMRRPEVTCMLSCQCLHCSHTCTKWAYIWHILSVNAQTRLSLHCSHTCTKWAYIWHILSVKAHMRLSMGAASSEPLLPVHRQNVCRQIIRPTLKSLKPLDSCLLCMLTGRI